MDWGLARVSTSDGADRENPELEFPEAICLTRLLQPTAVFERAAEPDDLRITRQIEKSLSAR